MMLLARKQKGSANRAKARTKVAVAHRKIRETRKDSQHKYALALIRENQTITVEQLRVVGLARSGAKGRRGRGLRKSVHDASWGQFLRILTEKGAEHGRTIIGIDPAYTSQTCAVCGVIDGPKPLTSASGRADAGRPGPGLQRCHEPSSRRRASGDTKRLWREPQTGAPSAVPVEQYHPVPQPDVGGSRDPGPGGEHLN